MATALSSLGLWEASFVAWFFGWQLLLQLSPEGPRAIPTAYRLNFWHGVVSTAVASLSVLGYVPDSVAVPCSLAYFIVDVVNMLLNDLYHKVASYQKPNARKAEYFHHVLCIVVCIVSKLYYRTACQGLAADPVVRIMLAEVSTPFLITFRQTKSKVAGLLFLVTFILSRTVYQCIFLMPEIYSACDSAPLRFGLVVPYIMLQLYFTVAVVQTAGRTSASSSAQKESKTSPAN